jgi:hypothetical protein
MSVTQDVQEFGTHALTNFFEKNKLGDDLASFSKRQMIKAEVGLVQSGQQTSSIAKSDVQEVLSSSQQGPRQKIMRRKSDEKRLQDDRDKPETGGRDWRGGRGRVEPRRKPPFVRGLEDLRSKIVFRAPLMLVAPSLADDADLLI